MRKLVIIDCSCGKARLPDVEQKEIRCDVFACTSFEVLNRCYHRQSRSDRALPAQELERNCQPEPHACQSETLACRPSANPCFVTPVLLCNTYFPLINVPGKSVVSVDSSYPSDNPHRGNSRLLIGDTLRVRVGFPAARKDSRARGNIRGVDGGWRLSGREWNARW